MVRVFVGVSQGEFEGVAQACLPVSSYTVLPHLTRHVSSIRLLDFLGIYATIRTCQGIQHDIFIFKTVC